MRFQKIKWNHKDKVTLHWTNTSAAAETVTVLTSTQQPHPDFVAALDAFVPEVLALLELPEDYDADTMRVVGLSISYQEDGRRGLVVTCLKDLECAPAPLVLNTPHLPEPGDDESPALPPAMLRLLADAEREAERFVQGKRAQGDLFAKAADEATELAGVGVDRED